MDDGLKYYGAKKEPSNMEEIPSPGSCWKKEQHEGV